MNLDLLIATFAFVGTHLLLSHPLRAPLVARLGARNFLGLYSGVALLTFAWMILAFRKVPPSAPAWMVGDGIWIIATVLMLAASMLFLGSLVRNPALPNPKADSPSAGASGAASPAAASPTAASPNADLPTAAMQSKAHVDAGGASRGGSVSVPEARGVFAVTRHPMNWSFALWGLSHILVSPTDRNFIIGGGFIVLAIVGSALQDRKKESLRPDFWPAWEARTSFWPFAAIATGRARFGGFGMHTIAGGIVLWLFATWAHRFSGIPAGVWRWIPV